MESHRVWSLRKLTSSQTCPTPALSGRNRSFGFSKRERFSVSFARLSTSRKDAAACVSLSFLNDVKEHGTEVPKARNSRRGVPVPLTGTGFHVPIASGGDEGSTAPEGTISSMHAVI
jgi:hypothetical protein